MTDSPIDLHAALLEHGPFLRRLARALVREDSDAEDLVQDTYAAALRARPRTDAGLGGWLRTTARNLAHSRGRRRAVRGRDVGVTPDPSDGGESERTVERLEAHALLHRALAGLSEPWRTAVRLRFLEGLSLVEIGERTGTPPSTVRSRIERGLGDMRVTLDALGGGGRAGRDRWLAALGPVAGGAATVKAKAGWAVPAAILGLAGIGGLAWQTRGRSTSTDADPPRTALVATDEDPDRRDAALGHGGASTARARGSGLAPVEPSNHHERQALGAGDPPTLDSPHVLVLDPAGRPVPGIGVLFGDEAEPEWRQNDLSELPHTDASGRVALPSDEGGELPRFASAETALGYRGTVPVSRESDTSEHAGHLRDAKERVHLARCVELRVPHLRTLQLNVRHPEGGTWPAWTRTWLARNREPRPEAYGGGNAARLAASSSTYVHVPTGEPLEVHVDGTEGWLPETYELDPLVPAPVPKVVELTLSTRRLIVRGRLVDETGEPVRSMTGFLYDRARRSTLPGASFGHDPDFPGAEHEGRVRIIPGGRPPSHEAQLLEGRVATSDHHWSHEFTLRLPADIPDVDLEVGDILLAPRPSIFDGVAVAPDGRPLSHCECTLWAQDPVDGWRPMKEFMSTGEGRLALHLDDLARRRPLALSLTRARGYRGDTLELSAPIPVERGQGDVLVAPVSARKIQTRLRRRGDERHRYRISLWSDEGYPRPRPDTGRAPFEHWLPEGTYVATVTGPGGRRYEQAFIVPPVLSSEMPPLEVWIDVD